MKKTLLFLLFLIGFTAYSQPTDLSACDTNGDGVETFDLTAYWVGFPAYMVPTNYQTQADAENETNAIANPSAYVSGNSMVWVRVTDTNDDSYVIIGYSLWVNPLPVAPQMPDVAVCDSYTFEPLPAGCEYHFAPGGMMPITTTTITTPGTHTIYVYAQTMAGCFDETSFNVIIVSTPVSALQDGFICVEWGTDTVLQSYLLDTGLSNTQHTFQWYMDNLIIPGANSGTYTALSQGNYHVVINALVPSCETLSSAVVYKSGPASPIGTGYTIDGQNITMTINGYGNYQFAMDGGPIVDNGGIFTDVPLGSHTVYIHDNNGCGALAISNILVEIPNAPDGEPSQSFAPGQTLADVVVVGENIQWYANDSNPNGRMAAEETLPLSTVLVDGATYYASQTINGMESNHRLPVTVSLSLGIQNNPFRNFSYHPNPVKNNLEISNSETMDRISIYNVLGQSVVEETLDAMVSVLDLSGLKTGIYLAKIQSDEQEKVIRIIKE